MPKWKYSFPPFRENYDKTDQPINRLTDQLTDIRGHRKVTLQKSDKSLWTSPYALVEVALRPLGKIQTDQQTDNMGHREVPL